PGRGHADHPPVDRPARLGRRRQGHRDPLRLRAGAAHAGHHVSLRRARLDDHGVVGLRSGDLRLQLRRAGLAHRRALPGRLRERDAYGELERVIMEGDQGDHVVQEIHYDENHRVRETSAPGRGSTTASYDDFGRTNVVTAPDGVSTTANSFDPLTGTMGSFTTS